MGRTATNCAGRPSPIIRTFGTQEWLMREISSKSAVVDPLTPAKVSGITGPSMGEDSPT